MWVFILLFQVRYGDDIHVSTRKKGERMTAMKRHRGSEVWWGDVDSGEWLLLKLFESYSLDVAFAMLEEN